MARKSDPILVAASTAVDFIVDEGLPSVNFCFIFYTDVGGTVGNEVAIASGSRDVTVTNLASLHGGTVLSPTDVQESLEIALANGTFAALASRTWREVQMGPKRLRRLRFVAAPDITPGGALSYRLVLDVP